MTETESPIPRWRDAPPHDVPPLEWWAGVYDHVYVALHPFLQVTGERAEEKFRYLIRRGVTVEDRERIRKEYGIPAEADVSDALIRGSHRLVGWREAHEMFGKGAFDDFTESVFLNTCYSSVKISRHLDLAYGDEIKRWMASSLILEPEEDYLSGRLAPSYVECLTRIGVSRVTLCERPYITETPVDVSDLVEVLNGSLSPEFHGALYEDSRRVFMCSAMKMMDWTESLIAMTSEARETIRPEEFVEGFYATADTETGWGGVGPPLKDWRPERG